MAGTNPGHTPQGGGSGGRIAGQGRLNDAQVRETVDALFDGQVTAPQLQNAVATGVITPEQYAQISAAYVAAGGSPLPGAARPQSQPQPQPQPHPQPQPQPAGQRPESPQAGGAAAGGAGVQKFRIADLSHQRLLSPSQLQQLLDAVRRKLIFGHHVKLALDDGRLNRQQVAQLLHAASRASVTVSDISNVQAPDSAWPSEQEQAAAWSAAASGAATVEDSGSAFEVVDPADQSGDSFIALVDEYDDAYVYDTEIADEVDDAIQGVDFDQIHQEDEKRERGRKRKRKRNMVAILASWLIVTILSVVTIYLALNEYERMSGASEAVSHWMNKGQLPLPQQFSTLRHGTETDFVIRGNWLGRAFSGETDTGRDYDGAYAVKLWDQTGGRRVLVAEYLVAWYGEPRTYFLLGAMDRLNPGTRLATGSVPVYKKN